MSKLPFWLKDAVFYEIYPQSFSDTNSDGIGDINGIILKLDYIKELGCNAIWINPCFESPFADAGYDVSDYFKIASRYGTNDDAKKLFDEAHKRGMHVIFDLVPGHTSIEHKWFKKSQLKEKNEYTDRYVWTDSVWNAPNTGSISGWLRGFSSRDGSCAVNFFSSQPALNYGFYKPEESWQMSMNDEGPRATGEAMKDVVKFWLDMGCDGFRVDMAGSLVKNDPDQEGTILFWQRFFSDINEKYPNAAFVSEWGDPKNSIAGGFHMDFLLHFGPSHYPSLFRENPYFSKKGTGDISEFVKAYKDNMEKTQGAGLVCIPSGNHDMSRISYLLDDSELRLAYAFLLSMPGAPFIYYGDEIGMKFFPDIESHEGGYYRTGARTPMQWDGTVTAGFSAAHPDCYYLPLDPDKNRPNVKAAMADESSIWHEINNLIKIRCEHSALGTLGKIEFLYAEKNAYPFVYLRYDENEKIIVALNPSEKDVSITIPFTSGKKTIYYYNSEARLENGALSVPAQSASFIKL